MARATRRPRKVTKGAVDTLPSGAVRVRVDGGTDPVTKKRHRLEEIIPAKTPDKEAVAEQTRIRMLNEVNERRNPKTRATVDQLIERYLDQHPGAASTVANYRRDWRRHIAPFIGKTKVGALDADMLDSLYAELRRCRDHCTGPRTDHRTRREHECDERCRAHKCRPLGTSGVRQVHFILSGAYRSAVRWKWVMTSPVANAEPPAARSPQPRPPSSEDAARLVNDAGVTDLDWATLIWLAMTTGMRRHELCALRWTDVLTDGPATTVWVRRGISKNDANEWAEQDTKTHQQRRIAVDVETAAVLTEHHERCAAQVASFGAKLSPEAFLFSGDAAYERCFAPPTITQRFDRLAARLGIETTFHKLRHYSATELIKAGADINTVAGRLGHAGGGATTLRTYTAFVSETDQRAAANLSARMPERRWTDDPVERAKIAPRNASEKAAAALRQEIMAGKRRPGDAAPSEKELARTHGVSAGTAHRAMTLLKEWGVVEPRQGARAVVAALAGETADGETADTSDSHVSAETGVRALDLELLRFGEVVRRFRTDADPDSSSALQKLLRHAVQRSGGDPSAIGDYEMNVRTTDGELLTTYVLVE